MRGKAGKFIQNVAGDQYRNAAFAVQLQDQFAHFDDALRIQPVYRFIQHQKIGAARQRHGDVQPLAHAQRKIARPLFAGIRKPHQMQKRIDSIIRWRAQNFVLLANVFRRRHILIDRRRFHHRAHPSAAARDARIRIANAVQGIIAVRRRLQTADQANQRGFARAVSPDDSIDRALRHAHIQILQRGKIPIALCERVGFKHIFH